jgi:hypothetical protein
MLIDHDWISASTRHQYSVLSAQRSALSSEGDNTEFEKVREAASAHNNPV